jgi:hypothetical protein
VPGDFPLPATLKGIASIWLRSLERESDWSFWDVCSLASRQFLSFAKGVS